MFKDSCSKYFLHSFLSPLKPFSATTLCIKLSTLSGQLNFLYHFVDSLTTTLKRETNTPWHLLKASLPVTSKYTGPQIWKWISDKMADDEWCSPDIEPGLRARKLTCGVLADGIIVMTGKFELLQKIYTIAFLLHRTQWWQFKVLYFTQAI